MSCEVLARVRLQPSVLKLTSGSLATLRTESTVLKAQVQSSELRVVRRSPVLGPIRIGIPGPPGATGARGATGPPGATGTADTRSEQHGDVTFT